MHIGAVSRNHLSLILLAFLWGTALPGNATNQAVTLDQALAQMARNLTVQGRLSGQPLLIRPNDFYELGSGRSLPLAQVLWERMVHEFNLNRVDVLLPGAFTEEGLVLQGHWRQAGKVFSLAFKVLHLSKDGPRVAASDAAEVAVADIASKWLKPDLDSWGRDLVNSLENQAGNASSMSVHLKPFKIQDVGRPDALGEYLGDWLRPALAQSRIFRPIDAPLVLKGLDAKAIRTRGIGFRMKQDMQTQTEENMSLTGGLVGAEAEMVGKAYLLGDLLEVRMHVRDRQGRQVTAASARIDRRLFPGQFFHRTRKAKSAPDEGAFTDHLSRNGLVLELATTRGEARARYRAEEKIQFIVRTNRNAHLYLFVRDSSAKVALLFPLPGAPTEPLQSGEPFILPDDGLPYELVVEPPFGRDYVWAVASELPLREADDRTIEWQDIHALRKSLRKKGKNGRNGYAEAGVELISTP